MSFEDVGGWTMERLTNAQIAASAVDPTRTVDHHGKRSKGS